MNAPARCSPVVAASAAITSGSIAKGNIWVPAYPVPITATCRYTSTTRSADAVTSDSAPTAKIVTHTRKPVRLPYRWPNQFQNGMVTNAGPTSATNRKVVASGSSSVWVAKKSTPARITPTPSACRTKAAVTGIWTAGEKAGLAVGPAIYALILAFTGFVESEAGQSVAQTDLALTGIVVGFAVVPALLMLATIPMLLRYPRRPPTPDASA